MCVGGGVGGVFIIAFSFRNMLMYVYVCMLACKIGQSTYACIYKERSMAYSFLNNLYNRLFP